MPSPILGLHHVTATAAAAQPDLDFFAGTLGMRLVKRTVNFDNPEVYHFYYGDAQGTPGTIWTTFPYAGRGVRVGRHGSGQITATTLSVPAGSLDFWTTRLGARGCVVEPRPPRFGDPVLAVTDPSGLVIELCATDADAREPWTGAGVDIDRDVAVRGVHGVTLTIALPSATIDFMTATLGFRIEGTAGTRTRLGVGGAVPGHFMDVLDAPDAPEGLNGLGTVHHVAMAVATPEDQQAMRDVLVDLGFHVTKILDRQYFRSIYFREPGGVLFEIATVQPGFLVDEPLADLGRALKLPWWVERDRARIEAGLTTIVVPH